MTNILIPAGFFNDFAERGNATPKIHQRKSGGFIIDTDDANFEALKQDALTVANHGDTGKRIMLAKNLITMIEKGCGSTLNVDAAEPAAKPKAKAKPSRKPKKAPTKIGVKKTEPTSNVVELKKSA